jgi:hypothetical protein
MNTIIASPASCEVHAVIHFLHTEGQSAAEIHHQLCHVYGDNVMNDSCVREWCIKFMDGCTDVHDKVGQGQHTIVMNSFKSCKGILTEFIAPGTTIVSEV